MLSEQQISSLYEMLLEEVTSMQIESPHVNEQETSFTSRVLYPWLRDWVAALRKPGLYVRGDGGPSISPVVWHGITFRPDLGIYSGQNKYVAVEIKLLTNADPGGSLTKAVGQTLMYEELGFAKSLGLIFDLSRNIGGKFQTLEKIEINPRVQVHILGSSPNN